MWPHPFPIEGDLLYAGAPGHHLLDEVVLWPHSHNDVVLENETQATHDPAYDFKIDNCLRT